MNGALRHDTARQLMLDLFMLVQVCKSHGREHPLTLERAEAFCSKLDGHAPIALQFVKSALFVEQELVAMSWENFAKTRQLCAALARMGTHELGFGERVTPASMLTIGEQIARAARGAQTDLDDIKIPGVSWREIPEVSWGEASEEIDKGLFAMSQVALAIQESNHLSSTRNATCWDWKTGFSIVRRLERAMEADAERAIRALEMEDGGWTPCRRAVSAAMEVMMSLEFIGARRAVRRACAHAILGIAATGYEEHEGLELSEAAAILLEQMLASPVRARTGISPHRLRVTTIVDLFATHSDPVDWASFMFLLQLCYDLEWERCPVGVDFSLTRADLLAMAAQDMGVRFPPVWVSVLVSLHKDTPPGAYVEVQEGVFGVILGKERSSGHVKVMVGAEVVSLEPPLKLVSAARANGIWS